MCLLYHQTEMQDSSGNSSSLASSDSEHDPESLIIVRKSRNERKHKRRTSDLGSVPIKHNGHNEKHLRHRHHHHRHGHSRRVKEGRVHKRICPVQGMSLKAVRVKKEPLDGDNGRIRQPLSSHRLERRLASSDHHDDQVVSVSERQSRWGIKEENATSKSRPVKQEPKSEGEEGCDWGKKHNLPKEEKDKPCFGLSGKLAEDSNTSSGVFIKYSEPPEACKPKRRWRLYPFKGDECLPTLCIHRQSSYLIGRDRMVADIPVLHPSCSKQHAALQYRLVPFKRKNGTMGQGVRPYIIDLESSNGTFVNNVKIEARTYVELLEKDVIKFAFSSREYVLLHENSRDEQ